LNRQRDSTPLIAPAALARRFREAGETSVRRREPLPSGRNAQIGDRTRDRFHGSCASIWDASKKCSLVDHSWFIISSEQLAIDNCRYDLLHQRIKNHGQKDIWMGRQFGCGQHQTRAGIVHAKTKDN
jgi:hypothetical protein